ncbi:MAG: FKBP-type peptidyl-prolyl cis-trans isomerase [Bacteroidia bacterium]
MKKWVSLVLIAAIGTACNNSKTSSSEGDKSGGGESAPFSSAFQDSISYAIGASMGMNVHKDLTPLGVKIDESKFMSGFRESADTSKMKYSMKVMQGLFGRLQSGMQKAQMEKSQKEGKANIEKSKAFMEGNKSKEGVKSTASGLQYKVLSEGKGGKSANDNSVVKVNYKGTLIDGKEFDSSYKRGEPAEFPLGGVIKGWQEGIKLMKTGDKFQFFIPADLAYGEQAPPDIGPNQALIFEVELLEVKEAPAAPKGGQEAPHAGH